MATFFSDATISDLGIREAIAASARRAAAAIRAAVARRRARRDYRRLLDGEDHVLKDVGLSRTDLHAALRECDGR